MYDYTYYGDYGYDSAFSVGEFAIFGTGTLLVGAGISIIIFVALWKIFKKAGKKGWEAIIPIYNIIVLLEISGLPTWYLVLYLIPLVNIYAVFKTYIELSKKFGKDTGFGVLMVFFPVICMPILAFSNCTYKSKDEVNTSNNNFGNNSMNNGYSNMNNSVNTSMNMNNNVSSNVNMNSNSYTNTNGMNTMNTNVNTNSNSYNNMNTNVNTNNVNNTNNTMNNSYTNTSNSYSNDVNTMNNTINNDNSNMNVNTSMNNFVNNDNQVNNMNNNTNNNI